MITTIISGGQTGADQGGLRAALRMGIKTGGYAPKGWKTETGVNYRLYSVFGLVETESEHYQQRTELNILTSDGTLLFGRPSPGSNLTKQLCNDYDHPCLWIDWPPAKPGNMEYKVRLWVARNNIKVLNVAGNRESRNPGIGEAVEGFLRNVIPFCK